MRHLFRYEAEHLLARVRFVVERRYADDDWLAYGTKLLGGAELRGTEARVRRYPDRATRGVGKLIAHQAENGMQVGALSARGEVA